MKKRKQQRWVLRLPSLVVMMTAAADGALLMAFFQVCGVFGGCDDVSLGKCVRQLSTYERQVGDGNITYTDSELDELCRRYDDIAVCVRRATSTCPVEPSSHFVSLKKKQVWSGLDASFNFICKNGKRTYLNHVQCLSTHPIPSSLRLCNRTFHRDWTFIREKDFAHNDRNQELCLITNKFLECLYGVVRKHCGEEAATWEITVIQKLRQPKMELDYGCTLGCSTVRHRLIGFLLTVLLLIERLT